MYRTALTHYVDITSCPRTNVLRELAEYASDPTHKDFLLRITSATEEGKVQQLVGVSAVVLWEPVCLVIARIQGVDYQR